MIECYSRDPHVGSVNISPSNDTCNLGVIMDSSEAMSSHVSIFCKSASFALWKISTIRNAFVTSMVDYYNSLLLGLQVMK